MCIYLFNSNFLCDVFPSSVQIFCGIVYSFSGKDELRGFAQTDVSKSSERRCKGQTRTVNKEKNAEKHLLVLLPSSKVEVLDISVTWEPIYLTIVINRMAHQPEFFFLLMDQTSVYCFFQKINLYGRSGKDEVFGRQNY